MKSPSRVQWSGHGLLALIGAVGFAWYAAFPLALFRLFYAFLGDAREDQALVQSAAMMTVAAATVFAVGVCLLATRRAESRIARLGWLAAASLLILSAVSGFASAQLRRAALGEVARAASPEQALDKAGRGTTAAQANDAARWGVLLAGLAIGLSTLAAPPPREVNSRAIRVGVMSTAGALVAAQGLCSAAVAGYERQLAAGDAAAALLRSLGMLLLAESLGALLWGVLGIVLLWHALASRSVD